MERTIVKEFRKKIKSGSHIPQLKPYHIKQNKSFSPTRPGLSGAVGDSNMLLQWWKKNWTVNLSEELEAFSRMIITGPWSLFFIIWNFSLNLLEPTERFSDEDNKFLPSQHARSFFSWTHIFNIINFATKPSKINRRYTDRSNLSNALIRPQLNVFKLHALF
jgi:hypothetical protein